METIRQIVNISSDRKLSIDLPETIEPGLMEVVVVLQPVQPTAPETPKLDQLTKAFGFLPKRVDPLEFQKQLRDEWNR